MNDNQVNNTINKKKKNKAIYYILLIIVPIIVFIATISIYNYVESKVLSPEVQEPIEEPEKTDDDNKESEPKEEYINPLPGYRSQYNNNQIMGKLEIPRLTINTLVARANNNEYYLYYNLYNQRDELGVPFFDYRNIDLNQGKQLNIYGHNTQNTKYTDLLPFTKLEAYTDKNYFDNAKDVYLSIDERKITYEVIAVKVITDNDNEHTKVNFRDEADFLNHANKMINGSMYSRNSEIKGSDSLLVLQVCHYNPPNSYLLIICKEKK